MRGALDGYQALNAEALDFCGFLWLMLWLRICCYFRGDFRRTATTHEARKTWPDLAKTWLRFASDLEANECLLDEWGKPRPKEAQTEE